MFQSFLQLWAPLFYIIYTLCTIISAHHRYRPIKALKWNISTCWYDDVYAHMMQSTHWFVFLLYPVNTFWKALYACITMREGIIIEFHCRRDLMFSATVDKKHVHILASEITQNQLENRKYPLFSAVVSGCKSLSNICCMPNRISSIFCGAEFHQTPVLFHQLHLWSCCWRLVLQHALWIEQP